MSSLVIEQTRFVYGPTDQPIDRPTDRPTYAKQYTPASSNITYNNKYINCQVAVLSLIEQDIIYKILRVVEH